MSASDTNEKHFCFGDLSGPIMLFLIFCHIQVVTVEDAHIKHGQNLNNDVDGCGCNRCELGLQTVLNTWIESVFCFCFFTLCSV